MSKKKICFIAGTRPEIIKVAPVIKKFNKETCSFDIVFCITGQHKEMAEQAIKIFDLSPDYNLKIMSKNQTLNSISAKIFEKLPDFFEQVKPDLVFVQGDTTTAAISGLVAFNMHIPVAHIEAGLRTYNLMAPFPEELNRRIISNFSRFNFVPTKLASQALLKENCNPENITITGNTVVDSLEYIKKTNNLNKVFEENYGFNKEFILITAHRRENFGEGFENICKAISSSAIKYPNIEFVYPVHLNPNVREVVNRHLSDIANVKLLEPASYIELLSLIQNCMFCVTDSGGIQEEAPSFGKYTIVLREATERMESVISGHSELVGTNTQKICDAVDQRIDSILSTSDEEFTNPFGHGDASEIIYNSIKEYFFE